MRENTDPGRNTTRYVSWHKRPFQATVTWVPLPPLMKQFSCFDKCYRNRLTCSNRGQFPKLFPETSALDPPLVVSLINQTSDQCTARGPRRTLLSSNTLNSPCISGTADPSGAGGHLWPVSLPAPVRSGHRSVARSDQPGQQIRSQMGGGRVSGP